MIQMIVQQFISTIKKVSNLYSVHVSPSRLDSGIALDLHLAVLGSNLDWNRSYHD